AGVAREPERMGEGGAMVPWYWEGRVGSDRIRAGAGSGNAGGLPDFVPVIEECVGTIADAARRSACATLLYAEGVDGVAGGDADVLLAVGKKAHRVRADRAAGLKVPKGFAGRRIEREDIAFIGSSEDQSAGRG